MKKRLLSLTKTIAFLFLGITIFFIHAQGSPAHAQNKNDEFRLTILSSTLVPQKGMILQITGTNKKYESDENGVIAFSYRINQEKPQPASLFFPDEPDKAAYSFHMTDSINGQTLYLDSPKEIAAYKQNSVTQRIEGIVQTQEGEPLPGAIVAIQGTNRKTISDEIGLFAIDADFNHPIVIRAEGMKNRSMTIYPFLHHPKEAYPVYMAPKDTTQIYTTAEQIPQFPGGMKSFLDYQREHLIYPPEAKAAGIEGVVVVRFIVEKDGSITDPTVIRGLEATIDSAALSVIKAMPQWIPAVDRGDTVRYRYSVPIQFKLKETERPEKTSGRITQNAPMSQKK